MSTEIRFPKKMEVESPKTDKLIDAQIAAFNALSRNLQDGFTSLLAGMKTLEKMPDMLQSMQRQIGGQLSTMFAHQTEAAIVERHASLLAMRRTAEALRALAEEKGRQLGPDRERIQGRYLQMLAKVAAQCEERIRALDTHALELLSSTFPRHVERCYSAISTPTIGLIAAHHAEVDNQRRASLREAVQAVREVVASLDRLSRTVDDALRGARAPSDLPAGWYALRGMQVIVHRRGEPATAKWSVLCESRDRASQAVATMAVRDAARRDSAVTLAEADVQRLRDKLRARGRSDLATLVRLAASSASTEG